MAVICRSIAGGIRLVAVAALALPAHADACSCYVRPLAERYAAATVILVARIGERHDGYDGLGARTTGWSFEAVEVLKGQAGFDRLLPGDCGGHVLEGEDYLVFTGDDGRLDSCNAGELRRNARYRADLEVLRRVRAGDLQVPAEPWVFDRTNGACSLSLEMSTIAGLSFDYRFADRVDPDRAAPEPANLAGFRGLKVWYPYSGHKVAGTGRVMIGGMEWPTHSQTVKAADLPFDVAADPAFGEILSAVESHEAVSLSAEYENFPYNPEDYPDFPEIRVDAPHYYRGTAVRQFRECMDRAGQ